ncbi:MAG: PKD domain-containing protein [Streptosporangiaceae bacterium]|nr:PKD domain-containing protein [Streptosporangiaceae bacterium]MBV9855402.1 PKD domain-containing protein [Streptosporangiaceae bacterium]
MHIRLSGIVLVASAAIAVAGPQLAAPMSSAATAPSPASRAPAHPVAYVPLRGARGTGFDRVFTNMDYNGGPVMPSNTDYMVLWGPAGPPAYPAGYVSGLKTFFGDLAHDSGGHQNADSVSAQYNDLTGAFARYKTTFGGVLVDTHPYPPTECPAVAPVSACLTDPQIQTELERFVASRGLKTDLSHEYFLLTPPHVESCFSNQATANPPFGGCSAGEPANLAFFCAYHQNTTLSPLLLYANDPFDATNPSCQDGNRPNGIADGEINGGLSHEQNESVTDPIPNDAWTNGAGKNQGQEVGDQCVGHMGTPLGTHNGAKYNQVINGHFYWFQEEWSNQAHSCLQRLEPRAARPHATFTVTAGSGRTLNFSARGSSAPGGVAEYVWQFNDAFGAQTVERTTPAISHTFPSAGAYSVGLTIMAKDGTSAGNGGIVTTGRSGITPGFSFGPEHARPGRPVRFSALGTVSAQPVMAYLWEFGDGTTGSGRSPAHVYRRPGRYTVTLVMFSGVGSAFPGAGAATVSTRSLEVTRR